MTGSVASAGGLTPASEVVDAHVHFWPRRADLPRRGPELATSLTDLHQTLRLNGIGAAIASPSRASPANSTLLRACAQTPWLHAVPSVWITDEASVRAFVRGPAAGAVGARICFHGDQSAVDQRLPRSAKLALARVIEKAAECGIVVQWTSPMAILPEIEREAARFPLVQHVLEHLGCPRDARDIASFAPLASLADLANVAVKFSGMYGLSRESYPYLDVWEWAAATLEAFGERRLMWASDWPGSTKSVTYRELLELPARMSFIRASALPGLLGQNARSIWSAAWSD